MRTTQQMSITLPNEMADVVKSKVRAGEYASESEVIRDGLRALMARDRVIEAWLRETAVPAGLKDDPAGHSRPTRSANSSRSAAKPRGETESELCRRLFPEALEQLEGIEDYISHAGSPAIAARYVDAIVASCIKLADFPMRGRRRDDLMPGLRITNHRGRAVIAFMVDERLRTVSVIGVFYGGQDYESVLEEDEG